MDRAEKSPERGGPYAARLRGTFWRAGKTEIFESPGRSFIQGDLVGSAAILLPLTPGNKKTTFEWVG
ncbi:hypothetical protein V6E00_14815 [Serratia marcescens]|uniref:hypothetical protein n=1 Tax=Serratia marcescens TaxID=615 RepID=UPI002FD9BE4D